MPPISHGFNRRRAATMTADVTPGAAARAFVCGPTSGLLVDRHGVFEIGR